MFESAKAIREAKKAQMVEKARRKAKDEENQRIQKALEKHGVALSPEVSEAVFRNNGENSH